jgi:hypothetical protein
MIRWTATTPSLPPQKWQSHAEILQSRLASTVDDPELVIRRSDLLVIRSEVRELRELLAAQRRERERLAFKCKLAAARFESAFLRYGEMLRKAGFNPNQPRVPAGNPDGGQWTSEGGDTTRARLADAGRTLDSIVMSDASPDPIIPGTQYAQTQITIDPSALTGFSNIDDITKRLTVTLADVLDVVKYVPGLSPQAYGRIVHEAFAAAVRLQRIPGIAFRDVETTFGGSHYGSKGSIRTDVVLRNEIGEIIAIYDVKTGAKEIDPARAAELRTKTGVRPSIPIIEMSILRGVLRKGAFAKNGYVVQAILV